MSKIKVAINGTGRIGLGCARLIGERDDMELVALNSTASVDMLLHLIKYDSVHGSYEAHKVDDSTLSIGKSKKVKVLSNRDIKELNFGEATCVLECTGKFNDLENASLHLQNNVKKVIISAPAKNTPMFVYGVNHKAYKGEAVISNASCTTNALAPVIKVLHDTFGLEKALMTTIHSYTNDQNVLDVKHKDKRRARASALNMIPTSTGAALAIGKILPELNGKLDGFAVRVPTPDVSLIDVSATLKKDTTKEELNEVFTKASKDSMKGIIEIDNDERVSSDFIGSRFNCIYVPDKTLALGNNIKVLAWYDNEIGYVDRLLHMALYASTN
ncbi:type I glyceraldehyde-3-phosphate dehydrogenase [Helicobacter sp. 11S02629-2]|uniref:type I glyceraldehyde-3-phosphate dehydrogenase n=1 Tax=Helicobacter sp. 11S02629-2 TaxID=1476195 RepID=UPI000BA70DB7|nr:type I glyceraldehyde-3-phosphate dehydrogenase [Helicobacter sp. 11S02629-2]PAF45498.1 type I glyceraldehyde-3-phosphate dehydrogenase [Helicobacter sp. 11S02629-2]